MGHFSIGEVCRLLQLKPHVLRYWEKELPFLSPRKDISGKRYYSARDIALLHRLRYLLYDKRYTIEGAKRRIFEEMEKGDPDMKASVDAVRSELLHILSKISRSTLNRETERKNSRKNDDILSI